jgi:DNA-binding beta-propeller fold protein YncE
MIFFRIRIVAISIAFVLASPIWAQNASNPIQVALLRWYQANTAVNFSACTGGKAGSAAFDGKHVWVTCYNINEVEELNASDGSLIATVTSLFSVPSLEISNILYDGANLWVSGSSSTTGAVVRLNVAAVNGFGSTSMTCSALNTSQHPNNCVPITNIGSGTFGLTFDGTNVWVANSGSNSLSKIPPNSNNATTVTPSNCSQPIGVAFSSSLDGSSTYVWVTCYGSNTVQVLQQTGGANQYVLSGSGISAPTSIAYDGSNMWVQSSGGLNEISTPAPFTVNPSFPITGNGGGGFAFDGKYMWVRRLLH